MEKKKSYSLFSKIYELCAKELDSGKYDSVLIEISLLAYDGKELNKED